MFRFVRLSLSRSHPLRRYLCRSSSTLRTIQLMPRPCLVLFAARFFPPAFTGRSLLPRLARPPRSYCHSIASASLFSTLSRRHISTDAPSPSFLVVCRFILSPFLPPFTPTPFPRPYPAVILPSPGVSPGGSREPCTREKEWRKTTVTLEMESLATSIHG